MKNLILAFALVAQLSIPALIAIPKATVSPVAVQPDYGKLPLSFQPNRGQADAKVMFTASGHGYSLHLTAAGANLSLFKAPETLPLGKQQDPQKASIRAQAYQTEVIDMSLLGANANASVTGADPLPGKVNYFLGNDPTRWFANIPTFSKVRYIGVYPGVDLVYYGNQQQLEYDFIVAPGASANPIRFSFSGASQLHLDSEGNLQVLAAKGAITFHKPRLYQLATEKRVEVPGTFRLAANNTVHFTVGAYDHSRPLVIDPVLTYSTYLGGTIKDQANAIAVDAEGSAYVVGQAQSTDFPVTTGAYEGQHSVAAGSTDSTIAFVSKFNAAGTALVYSTYLGGTGGDYGYGIALDAQKNAYITGETASSDFPTTCGVLQAKNYSAPSGASSAFAAKLSPTGDTLVYSTFLGGTGSNGHGDSAQSIAVDDAGNAFVTGYSATTDFPITHGAFQTKLAATAGNSNAFVTKLSPDATALVYSTFLGGNGSTAGGDFGNAIAIDADGNAFVTGNTASANFPVTARAYQIQNKSFGNSDAVQQSTAFVTELNPSGDDLVYSTFLGGSYGDSARAITVVDGFAYVAGASYSTDFPVTDGVLEGSAYGVYTFNGSIGFLTKVNPTGSALAYSTYLGGATESGTVATGVTVDAAGVAYVTGSADVELFASTPNSLPMPTSILGVTFLVKLNPTATAMNYFTYLGSGTNSTEEASGNGVALDSAGNAYVAGYTDVSGFPTTTGAFQTVNHASATNGRNAFVSKLALASENSHTPVGPPPDKNLTYTLIDNFGFGWIDCPNTYSIGISAGVFADYGSPTGTITFSAAGYNADGTVDPTTGEASAGVTGSGGISEGDVIAVYANYNGDRYFASSGDADYSGPQAPYCDESSARTHAKPRVQKKIDRGSHLTFASMKRAILRRRFSLASAPVFGPRFAHPATKLGNQINSMKSIHSSRSPAAVAVSHEASASCVLPTLTVYLHPLLRRYGAANTTGSAIFFPSRNANTLIINESIAADASSPVGSYAVTGTISGPGADTYSSIHVIPTTLLIKPAPLQVLARSHVVRYGQTPDQPTGFSLFGFRNGDTASVVSGSPDLSTTITPATPVGYYPIQIGSGSLNTANYFFYAPAHHGVVHVYKAILTVAANDVTIHRGDTLPALTYSVIGFVNGDSFSSSVTGAPSLTTSATPGSTPGTYPIYLSTYPLKSGSYDFTGVTGKLTILP